LRSLRPFRDRRLLDPPLDADPDFAEVFHALTPGRQKSWALHLNDAKAQATKLARIEGSRPRILAGKGAIKRQKVGRGSPRLLPTSGDKTSKVHGQVIEHK
jgi:hypothetical protein